VIIIERPCSNLNEPWRIALVTGYDHYKGSHSVRYASDLDGSTSSQWTIDEDNIDFLMKLTFETEETDLILAVREYYILFRASNEKHNWFPYGVSKAKPVQHKKSPTLSTLNGEHTVGSRIEVKYEGKWITTTLRGIERLVSSENVATFLFSVVTDDGIVKAITGTDNIRIPNKTPESSSGMQDLFNDASIHGLDGPDSVLRHFPFMSRRPDSSRNEPTNANATALKRNWSALSLVEAMRPVELSLEDSVPSTRATGELYSWKVKLVNCEGALLSSCALIENPPRINVVFAAIDKPSATELTQPSGITLISALKSIHFSQKWQDWSVDGGFKLFYSVNVTSEGFPAKDIGRKSSDSNLLLAGKSYTSDVIASRGRSIDQESRCRKLSARSPSKEEEKSIVGLCEGLDEFCVKCMELLSILADYTDEYLTGVDKEQNKFSCFANDSLSSKLTEQVDYPLAVVGGLLPDWCVLAPSFTPRVFSYESRRLLLERVAFGVSRATLKQQEAKVNVGRLRQRMAALRGRAVELVGEAFSGGADDPTALQLQADELYGMEEALAARVRAAFRSVKWQEHALQVAKVAIRRNQLLSDATIVMEKYATDTYVNRRRLEVRFDGESGFDAASGDEAGVTRGFYADVAESLVSCENVAGIFCPAPCALAPATSTLSKMQLIDFERSSHIETLKLPLWIPDMDSSSQVVIPTPRAAKKSGLGVYPRPLPSYHPLMPDVLQRFRFIGRLFAAALRDGFMFPLPLSAAFLKLVQSASLPNGVHRFSYSYKDSVLTSEDLPRPGFLGGEVFAIEEHICKALDCLDSCIPPLSRHEMQHKYNDIATDKNFANIAFGKSYECSFEEYVQDRTFVDPLDPSQGEEAIPLCSEGHKKPVTIYNVREWVALAKKFILFDGVIAQAMAFRSGVEDFFSADYLRLFTAEELQRDICGGGDNVDNWDDAAVRKLFKLDGKFHALKVM
jgi:hypothetical protein